MPEVEKVENLDTGAIETQNEETQDDNSQEETQAPDPKEKRHAEQLAGSKKEVDKWRSVAFKTAVSAARLDANTLVELYSEDPKLAEDVSKSFGYSSYADLKNKVFKEETREDDFDIKYAKKRAEEVHNEALAEAQEMISKLPDELQEEAQKLFDEATEGKLLTKAQALKFAEVATLYVNREKVRGDKKDEAVAKLASTGSFSSKKSSKDSMVEVIDPLSGKLILVPNTFN